MTNRGFTTQEHMQDAPTGINLVNLINLNGRLYDPQLARMISADPGVQSAVTPYDPQAWNSYAYARNNPLGYTDPTGYDFQQMLADDNPSSSCSGPCTEYEMPGEMNAAVSAIVAGYSQAMTNAWGSGGISGVSSTVGSGSLSGFGTDGSVSSGNVPSVSQGNGSGLDQMGLQSTQDGTLPGSGANCGSLGAGCYWNDPHTFLENSSISTDGGIVDVTVSAPRSGTGEGGGLGGSYVGSSGGPSLGDVSLFVATLAIAPEEAPLAIAAEGGLTAAERVAQLAQGGLSQIQRERFVTLGVTETQDRDTGD